MRKPLVEPFYKKRAVIVRQPAFQAGCRGFESLLPLHRIDRLCAGRSEAAWWPPGADTVSKEAVFLWAKRRAATSCLDFVRHPAFASRIASQEIFLCPLQASLFLRF